MERYEVTGMSCAACAARVEKAVSSVEGVTGCTVSLLTNSMAVEGTADSCLVITAVEKAGYGASLKTAQKAASSSDVENALKDHETPALIKRLIASVLLLIPLMYVSMGHMMWGWPLPAFFDGNHIAMGLVQLVLSAAVMVINQKFFISGFKALWHRAPNMDTLVALGSFVSFIWSAGVLFLMTRAQLDGDSALVSKLMMSFYFESAAMILTLITVGKMLEARSKGKTTDALKQLMRLAPTTAVILKDGMETEVPIEQVKKGDVFIVRPGDSIPVDGIVLEGRSAVNESALTGESVPVDKEAGSVVSAATVNQSGWLRCEASRVGEDTTLSQIIRMVSDAAATKAPIAKIADKVSGVFVPVVICISVVTLIVWLLIGQSFGYALARGISVLVISCPCALGLATPVAIMVGNGVGARNGILFKTAASLEETGRIDVIALDKTGTITKGEPQVTDLIPADGFSQADLLSLAASLEQKSEHPFAKAIMEKASSFGILPNAADQFSALVGNGVQARMDGHLLTGGSMRFLSSHISVPDTLVKEAEKLADQGKTPLLFAQDDAVIGLIGVADVMKEDSPDAIRALKNMGLRVVMLTGDNERTAHAIGKAAGVDEVVAGVLPDGKEAVIRRLSGYGKVAMVGDGINDAPALTRADIGIAIGAGTDVAIDAADVVLMHSRLSDVAAAIRLSRATLRNIHENLFWAFIYNIIGIPLAAGVFIPLFGWELNPMFGAAAMSLSSFCVVTNALRLNLFHPHDPSHDRPRHRKQQVQPEKELALEEEADSLESSSPVAASEDGEVIRLSVEGMMCPHCEATVKKALEALPEILEATADYETDSVTARLSSPVDEAAVRSAVEKAGYTFLGIQK